MSATLAEQNSAVSREPVDGTVASWALMVDSFGHGCDDSFPSAMIQAFLVRVLDLRSQICALRLQGCRNQKTLLAWRRLKDRERVADAVFWMTLDVVD